MSLKIGDTDIKKVMLGDTEIKAVYVGDEKVYPSYDWRSGCVFYAQMNSQARDQVSNTTPTGSGTLVTDSLGNTNSAIQFGLNDRKNYGVRPLLPDGNATRSFIARVKLESSHLSLVSGDAVIFDYGNDYTNEDLNFSVRRYQSNTNLLVNFWSNDLYKAHNFTPGWHTVGFTIYNGNMIDTYIDGSLTTGLSRNSIATNRTTMSIGNRSVDNYTKGCTIEYVVGYNKKLSQGDFDEIAEIMKTKPTF